MVNKIDFDLINRIIFLMRDYPFLLLDTIKPGSVITISL